MLYRALCGRLPYWSKNPMAIAMAQVRDHVPDARRAPEVNVDPALEAIVRRCMHRIRRVATRMPMPCWRTLSVPGVWRSDLVLRWTG